MEAHQAVDLLIQAIQKVKTKYLYAKTVKDDDDSLQTERSFSYELYHQFRKLLDCHIKDNKADIGLMVSCEVTKQLSPTEESSNVSNFGNNHTNSKDSSDSKNVIELKESGSFVFYPDLLIHGGAGSQDKQIMICEIKRFVNNSNPDNRTIQYDIIKLTEYLSRLNFRIAVFIMLNCTNHRLKERLRNVDFSDGMTSGEIECIGVSPGQSGETPLIVERPFTLNEIIK